MPKMKTSRAAAKRFKVTGTGKLKRSKAYKRHILTKKTTKNTKKRGRPASKSNTKRTASSRKNTSKKTKQASPLAREIVFLALFVFAILSLLSLFQMCGVFGKGLSALLFGLLGALAYVFPVYLVVTAGLYLANAKNQRLRHKVWYSAGIYWSVCGLFQWVVNDPVQNVWEVYTVCAENHGGGGFFGGILSFELARVLGRAGSFIVILALFLLFFMLLSKKLIFSSIQQMYKERETDEDYYYEEPEPVSSRGRQMSTYTFDKEETAKAKPKKETRKKRAKKAETEIPENKNTVSQKEIKPEAQMEEVVPEVQDLSEINIIRGGEEPVRESSVYEKELEEKFGASKKTQSEPKTPTKTDTVDEPVKQKKEPVKITKEDKKEMDAVHKDLSKAATEQIPYRFPSLDLLNKPKSNGKRMDNSELRATAAKLQSTLDSFGVRVKMGDISLGPSVTRYELIPEQGVKVSRITGLSDDIKLSLAASDIRIEAPIPGKAAVGIEVPNPAREMITLRELLESSEFTKAKSKVTFAVGKDISGKTIVTDIAKMPHLLIAGATGSGKSVLINTLIMSIIYKADPNEVKMIMVDPKMVELTAYEDIPHLMIPVVKDPKKASAALGWAVAEMTGRYQKFADAGVRDIKSYNAKMDKLTNKDDPDYQKMPQIVIIVDEFADLMMVAPGEVEDSVCRLAQLARAAGIHLVLATQRPSVNVITGLIKANIPSRIALSVSSAVDSRTIIDSAGAEKLLGNGDMLFAPQNLPKPIRVQGAFVSDEERDSVVSFLKEQSNGPSYNEEVTKHIDTAPVPGAKNDSNTAHGGAPEQDELFVEAARFIIEKDKASIGLLQRMFRIGFNRAARIMDQLSDAGVVGPEEGTKPRQILMSIEQFENYLEENG